MITVKAIWWRYQFTKLFSPLHGWNFPYKKLIIKKETVKRSAASGERAPKPLAARAARRGGKRRAAPGRTCPSLWLPEPLRPGKTQGAGATESALLWRTRKLEPHSTQGLLHIERPGAWAVWTGKAQTPLYGANPVWPEHGECYPHTAMSVCSAPPSPQQDWSEPANLNKRLPLPACVRAEIRHRRDGKQKPNKQRESLQKGPVQQIKIPEGNADYTGRGL